MIKLTNLNKYYNKNTRNEIHVVNNISLEFPKTGLVCLLGPSGSGKTTLLNVIGGLDNIDSGNIEIDDKKINSYSDRIWNFYRNRKFGYIFQNYLLLPDLTVYQNLELCLKVFNLSKKEEEERINYALKAVGMDRFKNRKPTELSGGQQQRVSIARALIKTPDVYIADEPTGNVDENNTTQIMNILKKISQNSLIILVTHESRLAEFYGDRIIELKDGRIINDYINDNQSSFDRLEDNNIYLQEFNKETSVIKDVDFSYFSNNENTQNNIKLNVIFRNNTFYIHTNKEDVNIKFIDDTSEIKVIDSKKPVINLENIKSTKYDLPKLESDITSNKDLSLKINYIFKLAFDNIKNLKIVQKILIVMFFIASIVLTYGIASYNSSNYVNENIFLDYDRDLIRLDDLDFMDVLEIYDLEEELDVDYFLPNHKYVSVNRLYVEDFYQRNSYLYLKRASIFPLKEKNKLIMGRLPETPYELVVDKSLVDQILNSFEARSLGLKKYEQFINLVNSERFGSYTIVGIVDSNNPIFYATEEGYKLIALNKTLGRSSVWFSGYYFVYEDRDIGPITLINNEVVESIDDLELAQNQILVSNRLFLRRGRVTEFVINGYVFEIVGTYDYFSVSDESLFIREEQLDFVYNIALLNGDPMYFISNNKAKDLELLKNMDLEYVDVYDNDYKSNVILENNSTALFYSIIIGVFTLVFLYFIMRSSVISRAYSIGVFRALGVGRKNIIAIFVFEILLITLVSTFIGVFLFSTVIMQINKITPILFYPWYLPLITLLVIVLFNVLIGILPVIPYIRKTPSQILSKFDM